MAKKKIKFLFDSPVTTVLVLLSFAVFFINIAMKGSLIPLAIECRSIKSAENAFDVKNALDYLKIFTHIFANPSFVYLLSNSAMALLLGVAMEECYGSLIIGMMSAVTALVSGVLTVCSPALPFTGLDCIIFMLIFLSSLTAISKRTISLSWILILVTFIACRIVSINCEQISLKSFQSILALLQNYITVFINIAAGLAGSLLGFFIAPKSRKQKPSNSTSSDDTTIIADSPKKKGKKAASSDETVVASYDDN